MTDRSTVRVDLRAILAISALALVVLLIIFVELCGREDVASLTERPATIERPTVPPPPTITPGPSPTQGPPTATPVPEPGGEEHDLIRQGDLQSVQDALEEYLADNGSYPSTENNIQTLCVFDSDEGCALEEVLQTIPVDPLGEPLAENGYWYTSDGDSYTVYAQRESEAIPTCAAEHPDHLQDIESLLCVQSP